MKKYVVVHDDTSDTVLGCLGFILLTILGCTLYFFIGKLTVWHTLELPYKYIACFYNFLILEPLKLSGTIWNWLGSKPLTGYPNLNLLIRLIASSLYLYAIWKVLRFGKKSLKNYGVSNSKLYGTVAFPGLVAALWFFGSAFLAWLFAAN
ncbi:MAG: hypothetical protein KKE44_04385 [Proteobacteria bacterium]|nr:hypothetical protein [Pseudomonadota bacterium]MBU1581969.1 hypothetical protein [Pseudomonadota bacterium]